MKKEHTEKLTKAPLQEVIFEVLWELETTQDGIQIDEGFDLALGKFAQLVNEGFPVAKRIVPIEIPVNFIKSPLFQFFKEDKSLPLLQIGKGIFAINDNDVNYVWKDTFRPLIHSSVSSLYESYANNLFVNQVNLRYIDAFEIPSNQTEDILNFIENNLQTSIHNGFRIPGDFKGINLTQQFLLEDNTEISINISSALKVSTGTQAVICQFIASNRNSFSKEDVFSWVDNAHEHLSKLFLEMLNKEFYESLK